MRQCDNARIHNGTAARLFFVRISANLCAKMEVIRLNLGRAEPDRTVLVHQVLCVTKCYGKCQHHLYDN